MNRHSIVIALSLLATATFAPACDDQQRTQHAQDKAKSEAAKAQANADQKKAELAADFAKTRVDYRATKDKDLVDIDRDIIDLRANAAAAAKAEYDLLLVDVTTRRETVRTNLGSISTSAVESWDATKTTVDKSIADLKSAVLAATDKMRAKTAAAIAPPKRTKH
jgi:hypothetical protein